MSGLTLRPPDFALGGDYWQCELVVPKAAGLVPPIWGWADMHSHWMAHAAFGGRLFCGEPDGPLSHALNSCRPIHGFCGLRFAGLVDGGPHRTSGFPRFGGWPTSASILHQQMYVDWVRRAWEGGLRLLVSLAVNNELLGRVTTGNRSGDSASVALQTELMHEFALRHKDFISIARSSAEARASIAAGRLAVVLGIEIDSPAGWDEAPAEADVRQYITSLRHAGITHIFPIHLADNIFGGTAVYHDLFDILTRYLRGQGLAVQCGAPFGVEFRLGESNAALRTLRRLVCGFLPVDTTLGHINTRGLTALGRKIALPEMMRQGMVIDIDHMSQLSADETISIAKQFDYPLVAGHASFRDLAWRREETTNIYSLANEYSRDRAQLQAIADLGGIIGVGLNQRDVRSYQGSSVENSCAGSARSWSQAFFFAADITKGGVAIGTDMNGMAGLPTARFGPHAASALKHDRIRAKQRVFQISQQKNPVHYGDGSDSSLRQCQTGERRFNINTEGVSHYGLLPDFLQDVRNCGAKPEALAPLFRSAEDYLRMWEKCERRAAELRPTPDL